MHNLATIKKEDLLPLERYINNINCFSYSNNIIEDYIQFLYANNVNFTFENNYVFSNDTFSSVKTSLSSMLEAIKKNNKKGLILFNKSFDSKYSKMYLDSFIGKPMSSLQNLLDFLPNIPNSKDFYSFYRKKGFFLLNNDEKYFHHYLKSLIKEPNKNTIFLFVKNINLNVIDFTYLINYKNDLFENNIQQPIYKKLIAQLNSFEKDIFTNPKIKNPLNFRSKIFILKLTSSIILNDSPSSYSNLIKEYQDILSFPFVYQFFKNNKNPIINSFLKDYKELISSSNKNLIFIKETSFFQKKYQISLSHLLQKNHISILDTKIFLQKIDKFLQSQKELSDCNLKIEEKDNLITFSLSSLDSLFLDLCKDFLNMILNDKKLFTNSNIYPNIFQKNILEKSLPISQQKTKKIKI